jgi:hypothetical protein
MAEQESKVRERPVYRAEPIVFKTRGEATIEAALNAFSIFEEKLNALTPKKPEVKESEQAHSPSHPQL